MCMLTASAMHSERTVIFFFTSSSRFSMMTARISAAPNVDPIPNLEAAN